MWRWLLLVAACGATSHPEEARYDADFDAVFSAVSDVVHQRVREVVDDPARTGLHTAWQQVVQGPYVSNADASETSVGPNHGYRPRQVDTTKYYARYDIQIVGPRPWHVEIAAHASSWAPGMAKPTVLPDGDPPAWLLAQRNRLYDEIHDRLRASAIAPR